MTTSNISFVSICFLTIKTVGKVLRNFTILIFSTNRDYSLISMHIFKPKGQLHDSNAQKCYLLPTHHRSCATHHPLSPSKLQPTHFWVVHVSVHDRAHDYGHVQHVHFGWCGFVYKIKLTKLKLGCHAGRQEVSKCRTRGESNTYTSNKCKKAAYSGFEILRRHNQKSKNRGTSSPTERTCPPKIFFLKIDKIQKSIPQTL